MAIIKKITMYVAIDESKLLNDSYYKERIEDDIEDGYTQEESLSNRASDALELIMENAMYNEAIVDDFEFSVEEAAEADEKSFEYEELVDRME
ncbi:hypothetical protein [Selenomonas ruminantium]|uniref:hypothetical protein n=1 Tax=Selenomonas ruminantium TaxID=971 RepID=UPI0026EFC711|nr:hypothetical protein [Selenomonas ruminantium]